MTANLQTLDDTLDEPSGCKQYDFFRRLVIKSHNPSDKQPVAIIYRTARLLPGVKSGHDVLSVLRTSWHLLSGDAANS